LAVDFDTFAVLFLLAPFLAAALAPLIERNTGPAAGWILAIVPAALCISLATTIPAIAAGGTVTYAIDWVPALSLRLSFVIDGLSLVFALLITGIGAFIIVYSADYLKTHPQRGRFLALMLLFMGAMLGLVLADSLPALFAFWELTAVSSFLLIGFDHARPAARRAAFQALVVTGIGGLSLMAGGVLLHIVAGTWNISGLAGSKGLHDAAWSYPFVVGFIVVAAFTKSAQWPFHFWLPNAMEAPTPVSAYLHSATMVQAGIYLLARLSPILSGTSLWQVILCTIGGLTLLWGAIVALKQTDMKQLLAHSTIASLGLMVMLLGLGTEAAILAVGAYFVAHALYKAGLFLVTGILDHGTGTRDITALGGLRDEMTISFIAAALAALSMFGLPPFLGWFAKEEIYASLDTGSIISIVSVVVLVLGNGLLGAVALAFLIRPFMGALKPTPQKPHEGSIALWIGPALFGLLGLAVVFAVGAYGDQILVPLATAVYGVKVKSHLALGFDITGLPLWLSVATWAIAGLVYWQLDRIRALLLALERRFSWSFDRGFDHVIFGLVRAGAGWTRLFHHGRLELYLLVVFAAVALVLLLPLWALGGWPSLPKFENLTFYEWGAVALAITGLATVLLARTRLFAILALGVQGLALALLFIFFGAPDLGFTQLMIEILSVVILTLVITRLDLARRDPRRPEDWLRDGVVALICGSAVAILLLKILARPLDSRLGDFFIANSAAIAHGRNIVNVILVDFRGLDTLGEISVVLTAGIAVLALLHRQHKRGEGP
jgi:multicomponent Na+:H+ antiporter subunit A